MVRLLMVVLLTLGVVGCRRHASASTAGPGYNAKREKTLFAAASPAIRCDPGAMSAVFEETVERNYHLYRVDGCGQRYVSLLHCTGPTCSWIEGPESRAASELQCPATQLARTYANRIFTISGCGRQASYQLDHGRLVSLQQGGVPPPPPPPPPAP